MPTKDSPNNITSMVAASIMFEIICLISINLKDNLVSKNNISAIHKLHQLFCIPAFLKKHFKYKSESNIFFS